MEEFKNLKIGDLWFSLIFGPGKIRSIWADSYYTFEVEFEDGHIVPYTPEGVPAWNNTGFRTLFKKEDIDLTDIDISPNDEILTPKKIIKLRAKRKLLVRCPSGFWHKLNECPSYVIEKYLEDGKFHLFKKAK